MGDGNHSSLRAGAAKGGKHLLLRIGIQICGDLIEKKNPGTCSDRPRDREKLPSAQGVSTPCGTASMAESSPTSEAASMAAFRLIKGSNRVI